MKLYEQEFIRIRDKGKFHIGFVSLGEAEILCAGPLRSFTAKEIIRESIKDDKKICKKCAKMYNQGERTWVPNSLCGNGGRDIGGYGGFITNER
jgi:hypothetical protein